MGAAVEESTKCTTAEAETRCVLEMWVRQWTFCPGRFQHGEPDEGPPVPWPQRLLFRQVGGVADHARHRAIDDHLAVDARKAFEHGHPSP